MKKYIIILVLLLSNFCWASSGWIMKPRLGYQVNTAHQLGPKGGLVFFGLFNEGSGNKVFDLSGNGNTGTFGAGTKAPTWDAGKFGAAIKFDGANDEIVMPGNLWGITFSRSAYAFSCWFRTAGALIDDGSILEGWGDFPNICYIKVLANGTVDALVRDGNENMLQITTAGTYDDSKWHFLVLVRYNATDTRLYIDNAQVGTDATNTGTITLTTSLISNGAGAGIKAFDGWLDNFIVHSRALSASEIALLYLEPFCMFEPSWNLVLYGGIGAPPVGGQVIFIN